MRNVYVILIKGFIELVYTFFLAPFYGPASEARSAKKCTYLKRRFYRHDSVASREIT